MILRYAYLADGRCSCRVHCRMGVDQALLRKTHRMMAAILVIQINR